MKVFISWSGNTSRQIAEALRDWLPMAIQAVKPYMSQRDNDAGVRWEGRVSAELASCDFGILCLTSDNIGSTWLNFEAGALGKVVDEARVVPMLYKLTFADVPRPLGMFMGKPLDEHGVKETLETMNKHLDAERRMDQAALDGAFKAMWPLLEEKLNDVEMYDTFADPQPREDRDILEEILELVRSFPGFRSFWESPLGHAALLAANNRLGEILGPDVKCDLYEYGGYIKGAPSITSLTPDEKERLDRILAELQRQGLNIVYGPEVTALITASRSGV